MFPATHSSKLQLPDLPLNSDLAWLCCSGSVYISLLCVLSQCSDFITLFSATFGWKSNFLLGGPSQKLFFPPLNGHMGAFCLTLRFHSALYLHFSLSSKVCLINRFMSSAVQVSLVLCSGTFSLCSSLRPPEPAVEQVEGRVGELFLDIVPVCALPFLFAEPEILQVNS